MKGTTRISITTIVDEKSFEAPDPSTSRSSVTTTAPLSHTNHGSSVPTTNFSRHARSNMDPHESALTTWTRDVQRCRSHQCPACRPIRRQVRFRSVSPPRPTMPAHSTRLLLQKRLPRRWWDDASSPKAKIQEPATSHSYTFLNMCQDACLVCHEEDDDPPYSPTAASCSSWTTEDLHPLNTTSTRTSSSQEFW